MRFLDKYPKLKEQQFLTELLTNTVYATMALENQQLEETKVRQIVIDLLNPEKSKSDELTLN